MQDDVIVPPSGRPDKSDTIRRAVEGLLAELSRVRPMMDRDHPRIASGAALSAVIRFLRAVDPDDPGDRHRPLANLLAALSSLEEGRTAPLLVATKFDGKPPDPVDVRTVRAQAVAVAEVLTLKAGMSRYQADRVTASSMYKHGIELGGINTNPTRAFQTLRKELNRKKKLNESDASAKRRKIDCDLSAHTRKALLADITKNPSITKGDIQKWLLEMLEEQLKGLALQRGNLTEAVD